MKRLAAFANAAVVPFALLALLTLLDACGAQPEASAPDAAAGETGAAPSSMTNPAVGKSALDVEKAIRAVDLGDGLAEARATLEGAIGDPAISDDLRDEATLALARCRLALGDREEAIGLVEALLEKRADKHPWRHADAADALLQTLVTGSAKKPARDDEAPTTVAPFARTLTPFFPVRDHAVSVDRVEFGAPREVEELGTFEVVGAIRAKAREACPLCDDTLDGHTSYSRHGTWTSIPAERGRLDRALVVYYFDLDAHRIPARYDALLPLPSADVAARLERGEGVVAVKSRPAAPPIVLIAAPREAQLADVARALSAMTAIPTAPVTVTVAPGLRPMEIRGVMRRARAAMRTCLEGHTPKAEGTVKLLFAIREDGTVADVSTQADAAVDEPTLTACLQKVVEGLSFAKTGRRTSVSYPLRIAP